MHLPRRNCSTLLVALVILLFLQPFAERGPFGRIFLSILATLVLLAGMWAVSDSRRNILWGAALALPHFVLQWISVFSPEAPESLLLVPSLYAPPFYMFLGYVMMRYLFQAGPITRDRLHAALCFYLLMGIFWAHCYVILEHVHPGSFRFSEDALQAGTGPFTEFMYFSYVTLTTLGYGDVAPVSLHARSWAILEAVGGVLFVGALVARIAGALGTTPAPGEED